MSSFSAFLFHGMGPAPFSFSFCGSTPEEGFCRSSSLPLSFSSGLLPTWITSLLLLSTVSGTMGSQWRCSRFENCGIPTMGLRMYEAAFTTPLTSTRADLPGYLTVVVLMTPGGGFFLSASFQMHLFLGACDVDGVSGTFRLNWVLVLMVLMAPISGTFLLEWRACV